MKDPKNIDTTNIQTILTRREVEGIKVAIYSSVQSKKNIDQYVDLEIKDKGIDFSFLDLRSQVDKIKEYLKERDLEGVNLEGANLKEANLYFANLKRANLRQANLEEACLSRANLERADLTKANINKANLWGANLKEANLEGANLEDADLRRANLRGANLREANFRQANLEEACFNRANLEGANFEGANFEGANLRRANLRGANLRGANLRGPNLEGADLRDATLEGVIQGTFSAMNNSDIRFFQHFFDKTLSSLLHLLKDLPDDQIKSMLKVEGTPLSEKLWTIVDNIKMVSNCNEIMLSNYERRQSSIRISKDDKEKISDFIDIIATKEKEIKEKEIPVSAPAIPSPSPSHESGDRVAKRQRVEGGARGD